MNGAAIVALNAGSSSIKFAVFAAREPAQALLRGQIDGIGRRPALTLHGREGTAIEAPLLPAKLEQHGPLTMFVLGEVIEPAAGSVIGVGHRVVHGGGAFSGPVSIDERTIGALEALVPLARSHQPHNLAAIRAALKTWPDVPHLACFDTAFHHTIANADALFAIPTALSDEGVRRYGFHGLSFEAIARQLPSHLGQRAGEPLVVAHLGNGASLCGMVGLQSRTTTMGFTPLDGLVMGRRPGRLDPGVLLYLMTEKGMSAEQISGFLSQECGLFGLSGGISDMRDLLAARTPAAALALDVFVARLVAEIGAAMATIGGLSALVFTGGVGENAAEIRARTVARLAWLGARLDSVANIAGAEEIGSADSAVRLLVLKTDEEATIARAVTAHIGFAGTKPRPLPAPGRDRR